MDFAVTDYIVFIVYCSLIIGMGLWVSRSKKGEEKTSEDYFLASKALPWWAIGASLIASNISAEQFIGMSGSGFAIGLGIATYEWMAAATLLVLGKFILPIFLKKGIYTMPQFLEMRYDARVRTIMAVFWLLVYVFVNLTSVLYLGALSIETIMGVDLIYAIIGLAAFAMVYSVYGGLAAVAWTDVIQVIFLVAGGLVTTWLALSAVSPDGGVITGFEYLLERADSKFDMILSSDHEFYDKLPGISVLIGGMWIVNLNYWGFNQYITQRALAGKSLKEAQRGMVFAGYLKLLMPLIVVIPGIVAFVLYQEGTLGFEQLMTDEQGNTVPDKAYPALLNQFVPVGLKGAAFAALAAAIVSSLSSMINSTATIFTMDIYKNYIKSNASEKNLVTTGRIVSTVALLTACLVAPQLKNFNQVFQYIQEFTGFVSPGVVAIFVLGIFWKKTTANAAFWIAILTAIFSSLFYIFFGETAVSLYHMAFINRMGCVFLIVMIFGIAISYAENEGKDSKKAITISKDLFQTGRVFNIGAIGIIIILAYLYATFW